jgi:hypothetical protein
MRLMLRACAIAILLVVPIAGCGSSPASPTPTSSASVSSVAVASASTSGASFQLTATARMSDGTTQDVTRTAAWDTSNPALATVSPTGMVTILGGGELDVRATYRGVMGSLHLLAARVPVVSIAITGAMFATTTFPLTATANLADGSQQDVTRVATWTSSDATIATVSSSGVMTVVRNGEVDIQATYQSVSGTSHLVVSQPKTFALTGVVQDLAHGGSAIASARVHLLSGPMTSVITDDHGEFAFSGLPAGRVLVEVTKEGYQVWETEIVILDHDQEITVPLQPAAN